MSNIFEELLEDATMTLTFEDDEEVECEVLGIFEADNGQKYIALVSGDEDDEAEDSEVLLYRFSMTEDGEPILENIEEEDEFAAASAAFEELLEDEDDDEE